MNLCETCFQKFAISMSPTIILREYKKEKNTNKYIVVISSNIYKGSINHFI